MIKKLSSYRHETGHEELDIDTDTVLQMRRSGHRQ